MNSGQPLTALRGSRPGRWQKDSPSRGPGSPGQQDRRGGGEVARSAARASAITSCPLALCTASCVIPVPLPGVSDTAWPPRRGPGPEPGLPKSHGGGSGRSTEDAVGRVRRAAWPGWPWKSPSQPGPWSHPVHPVLDPQAPKTKANFQTHLGPGGVHRGSWVLCGTRV